MRYKIWTAILVAMFTGAAMSYAMDDQVAPGTQAEPPSFGAQAGETARELTDKAEEVYKAASQKIAEATPKVEASAQKAAKDLQTQWNMFVEEHRVDETAQKAKTETQDAFKTLQEQWDVFYKQLQEKAKVMSQQLQQQWQDFNKSFKAPKS